MLGENYLNNKKFIGFRNPQIRSVLISLYYPAFYIGSFSPFLLDNYVSSGLAKMQLIIPFIFVVVLWVLPESPVFLASRNSEVCLKNWNVQ